MPIMSIIRWSSTASSRKTAVSLQITNGFATPFIESFKSLPEYAGTFGVKYPVILYSLSQISETLCILMIPFFMKRYGIKNVMLIAMFAWVARFALLGAGNPGAGVWMFILSMIVYGVAFDFFNISASQVRHYVAQYRPKKLYYVIMLEYVFIFSSFKILFFITNML